LVLVIKGVLSGRVEANTQNPNPKGRPFILRPAVVTGDSGDAPKPADLFYFLHF
jgi:hypothetical protein